MLNYFVLSTEITIYEALEIKEKLALEVRNKSEAYTNEYKQQGITKLGIWIDHDKILYEPMIKNCTLNVTVNARQFCKSGALDAKKVLDVVNDILVRVALQDVVWHLQNVSFSYTVRGNYAKEYVGLLNCGNSLSGLHIKKEVDNKKHPTQLVYSSNGMVLKFKYIPDEDCLDISLWLLKQKVATLAKRYNIESREFKSYATRLNEIEWYLWSDYIKRIAGEENYYSYKQAEDMIDASERSKTEKKNMKNVLKSIAVYKGLEHYMEHVADKETAYDFMESIRTEDTARKYISILRKEGINPVGISRRYAQDNNIHCIPSLITILKDEDVTRYRKIRRKQNSQEITSFDEIPYKVEPGVSELPFD